MTFLASLLRLAVLVALLGAYSVHAQVYCGPNGTNAYGQPCDPTAGGGVQQPGGASGINVPGQSQTLGPPVITNRSTSAAVPGFPQHSGLPEGSFPQTGAREFQGPAFRYAPRERNEFQDLVLQSVGRELPMFGYDLFHGVPSTFAPLDRVPVTPEYVVGPGDEIQIRGWGAVDIDYRAFVERDGTISIPQVGSINVAGLKFQDLQPYLKNAIGRVFRNFELNVSMGQLRSIQIFVVGHATRPGMYTISSLSTLVNALFASGGPTVKGSMRSIQLKRRDKIVTEFDMYELLLKGDKSKDVQLLPGDVVHIPPIGSLAAVSGSVNTPAIYEIRGEKSLGELLKMAGGLTTTADGQKATVERIVARRGRQVEDFALDQTGLAHAVRDGDVVTVRQVSPQFDNAITVRGNVAVPARHPYRAGMRVRDVVPDREALIIPDYWVKRNLIVRPDVTGRESFGLRPDVAYDLRYGTLPPDQRPPNPPRPLAPGQQRDSRQTQNGDPRQSLPLADHARQTNGQAADPRQPGARVGDSQQTDLRARDLRWTNAQEGRQDRAQLLRSEIRHQLTEVNWDYAVVERLNREDLTTRLIPFNLAKAMLVGDSQHNLVLQPGDVITIFSKEDIPVPDVKQTKFVRLEGEIATPGVYQALPGETLRQLVARVGGFTHNAYAYGAEFTRESVRLQQQKRLEESLDRLAQEIERSAATQAQRALDPADAQRAVSQAENHRRLLDRMRLVRATGRVVLDIPADGQLRDLPEIALEDGDRLNVPPRPSTVSVLGAVFNQNTFVYGGTKRVSDYLEQAGGPTREADSAKIYVLRADGSVTSGAHGSVFTLSSDRPVMPGDTIVVPEHLYKFQWTRELRDWSQIFYQFALGVAGLAVLRDF